MSVSSQRVKCCDIHPSEPWVLTALYSGHVFIWNYETQSLVKSFEVCSLPVRCAKFIPKKQWFVCGTDEYQVHVYNYDSGERVDSFEAHTDYIRCIAVHPTLPVILTSSDDMTIKLWDWEQGWAQRRVYEGHTHYVMQVEFNPKDTNTFASASLDRTINVWGLNSPSPHFRLEGHERGINCVSYFQGGDKPYLVSGADDSLVKVWDYQTKTCVKTLEGHSANVSAVCFHPELPIILSGAEDGTVRVWHSLTFTLENTLNYGMERVWSLGYLKGSNKVAIGYDDGTIVMKIGQEEPVVSMDGSGKVLYARNHEIIQKNVKKGDKKAADGERLDLPRKDLGTCDLYPQTLAHNKNGRLVCTCGDGDYVIYTALSLKIKAHGQALEFCWATLPNDKGTYAIRESATKMSVFKDFKKYRDFRPRFSAEGVFGGPLLGIRSSQFIDFYDWEECRLIRRIKVVPRKIFWSEGGDICIMACEGTTYVLNYNAELVAKYLSSGVEIGDQGIEKSFDFDTSLQETVVTGRFVGDCFIYTNAARRLQYMIGGKTITLAHLDRPMFLLGYLVRENRVYLMDKQHAIVSYKLLMPVLAYQIAIVRKDFPGAEKVLKRVPESEHNRLARFLESQDLKEMALKVSRDPEHRFDLALQLKRLSLVREIVTAYPSEDKWKQLGDLALSDAFDLKLTEECYVKAKDFGGLLLLYTSMGNAEGIEKLAAMASKSGRNNISFICMYLLNNVEGCIKLLCDSGRVPEAAFMSRTFRPSKTRSILAQWRENLAKVSAKAAEALADPEQYPDVFPDFKLGIQAEAMLDQKMKGLAPAKAYPRLRPQIDSLDMVALLKNGGAPPPAAPQPAAQEAKSKQAAANDTDVTPQDATPQDAAPEAQAKAAKPEPEAAAAEAPEAKAQAAQVEPAQPSADATTTADKPAAPRQTQEQVAEGADAKSGEAETGKDADLANLEADLADLEGMDGDDAGLGGDDDGATPSLDELNATLADLEEDDLGV